MTVNFDSKKVWIVCIIFFAVGIFAGWQLKNLQNTTAASAGVCPIRPIRESGYTFINPLLLCEVAGSKDFPEFKPLKDKIESFINGKVAEKKLTKASIYFRDYSGGKWVDIGPTEHYAPASLLKVPTMIAFLKYSEIHPEILKKQVRFMGEEDFNAAEHFKPQEVLQIGSAYTLEDLARRMVVYSDNNALRLVLDAVPSNYLTEVYTDLGLSVPPNPTPGQVDFMNVRLYAYFFRLLYNATYLTRENSEKAFMWLVDGDFPHGIVSAVPKNIIVGQKFGERTISDAKGQPMYRELHDCGIVYFPNRPYLLCVMTQGYDFEELALVIHEISGFTYEAVRVL